ncbi:hypothetical protein E3N88_00830 [Mikania micrantha]|uniref:RRM domain-containing protein n=1 Tax=Mikania micrantha TaxID=192012 RepID=A0A5N6PZ91_9ASTR|nr:hypothetical protein E3N88_00830 [Mikania micrantha]
MDGPWEQVRRRRSKVGARGVAGGKVFDSKEITFFVSNLPEGITEDGFQRIFVGFGCLSDSYLARKRDRGGNIFGFIRFKEVQNVHQLLQDLNEVKFEGVKLGVNIAKYNKGDALLEESHDRIIQLNPESSKTPRWWREYSLIGLTKDINILDNIEMILVNMGLQGGVIRYLGGLRILVSFPSPAIARCFLDDKKDELAGYFTNIEVWMDQDYGFDRIASINIYGIPAKIWDKATFNLIAEKFGRIILGSTTSYTECNLSYETVTILTSHMGKIDEQFVIAWGNQRFKIHVCESKEDWSPSFLDSSPVVGEVSQAGMPGGNQGGGRARKLNSQADEEREEGEILENDYAMLGSEAPGAVQRNSSGDAFLVHDSLIDPLGGNKVDGGAHTDPTPNKTSSLIFPIGLNCIGPEAGQTISRPRKRPRVDSEVGGNHHNYSFNMDSFSLGVQSLTPDLNLPLPQSRENRISSRRNRRLRSSSPRDGGDNIGVVGMDGIFCFGNNSNIQDPGVNDGLRPEDTIDPISVEAYETIKVGSLVGINLDQFKNQLEHVIGDEETQFMDNSRLPIKQFWGNKQLASDFVNARGRSGGLLSIWDPGVFVKHGVNKGDNFLHVFGSVAGVEDLFNIVNIYAPQDVSQKLALWGSLINLMSEFYGLWILLGDFNEVRSCSERRNSEFDHRGARDFNAFIFEAGLHEYRMGGLKFTYMSPDGSKCSKIDRVLVCDRFYHRWPDAVLTAHPRLWSDHSPLTLSTGSMDFGPPPFKFYSSWLYLQGIDEVVTNAMSDSVVADRPDVSFISKLRNVKIKVKDWRNACKEVEEAQKVALINECNHFETLAELGFLMGSDKDRFPILYGLDRRKNCRVIERVTRVDGTNILNWHWRHLPTSSAEQNPLPSQPVSDWSTIALKNASVTMLPTSTLFVGGGKKHGPSWQPAPQYASSLPQKPNRLQHKSGLQPQFWATELSTPAKSTPATIRIRKVFMVFCFV